MEREGGRAHLSTQHSQNTHAPPPPPPHHHHTHHRIINNNPNNPNNNPNKTNQHQNQQKELLEWYHSYREDRPGRIVLARASDALGVMEGLARHGLL